MISAAVGVIDEHKLDKGKSLNQKMRVYYKATINIIKCALFKSEANFQAAVMMAEPKQELLEEMWNLP